MNNSFIKKLAVVIVILLLTFLFRSFIFNLFIQYYPERTISEMELTNGSLKKEINNIVENISEDDIEELNSRVLEFVSIKLQYSTKQSIKDVNRFVENSRAHCVGYAALHSSVLNYTLKLLKADKKYEIIHQRGMIELLGINLNNLIGTNFFKNHDFVKITNIESGKNFYSDASLYEFSLIEKLKVKKEESLE